MRNATSVNSKIDAVQGLRGLAALLVVVDHSLHHFSDIGPFDPERSGHFYYVADTLGRHGVEIFFLISGFIMTMTSYDEFASPGAVTAFLSRRILRIVPLYWLLTALTVVAHTTHGESLNFVQIVKSLFFVPYLNDSRLWQPILRRGWTLNYEMFFYALFAAALLLRATRGLVGLLLLLLLLTVIAPIWNHGPCDTTTCGVMLFYEQPIQLYFAGGIVLGALRLYLQRRSSMSALSFNGGLRAAIVATAAYIAYICWVAGPTDAAGVVYCVLASALCMLFADKPQSGRISMLLLLIGESSYSLYLTHPVFIDPASRLWARAFGAHGLFPFLAAMIVGSCLLGWLSYRLIEKPLQRALRSRRAHPGLSPT
jgi:exopolysaccharide production protein ExoZ